jgi:hypothetical protein
MMPMVPSLVIARRPQSRQLLVMLVMLACCNASCSERRGLRFRGTSIRGIKQSPSTSRNAAANHVRRFLKRDKENKEEESENIFASDQEEEETDGYDDVPMFGATVDTRPPTRPSNNNEEGEIVAPESEFAGEIAYYEEADEDVLSVDEEVWGEGDDDDDYLWSGDKRSDSSKDLPKKSKRSRSKSKKKGDKLAKSMDSSEDKDEDLIEYNAYSGDALGEYNSADEPQEPHFNNHNNAFSKDESFAGVPEDSIDDGGSIIGEGGMGADEIPPETPPPETEPPTLSPPEEEEEEEEDIPETDAPTPLPTIPETDAPVTLPPTPSPTTLAVITIEITTPSPTVASTTPPQQEQDTTTPTPPSSTENPYWQRPQQADEDTTTENPYWTTPEPTTANPYWALPPSDTTTTEDAEDKNNPYWTIPQQGTQRFRGADVSGVIRPPHHHHQRKAMAKVVVDSVAQDKEDINKKDDKGYMMDTELISATDIGESEDGKFLVASWNCPPTLQTFVVTWQIGFVGQPEFMTLDEIATLEHTVKTLYNRESMRACDLHTKRIAEVYLEELNGHYYLDITATCRDCMTDAAMETEPLLLQEEKPGLPPPTPAASVSMEQDVSFLARVIQRMWRNIKTTKNGNPAQQDYLPWSSVTDKTTCWCPLSSSAAENDGFFPPTTPSAPMREEFLELQNRAIQQLRADGKLINIERMAFLQQW